MTLTRTILALAMIGAALTLAGCGGTLLESRKIDYKSAGKLPPLEVPPDLTSPSQDDRYSVPDLKSQGTASASEFEKDRAAVKPSTVGGLLPGADKVRLERAGTQRWLVVNAEAETVWPAIKDFWQELGFIVNVEKPEAGVMETDWAENRANIPESGIRKLIGKVIDQAYSTPERDKFRTRIERGAASGTTEVYISHRGMYEIYVSEGRKETKWQPRPADPDLEAEMLRRLMAKLGTDEARAQAELSSPKAEAAKAKLARNPGGLSELTVADGFDRAWRRVGLALDRIGFTVEDRDRSKGTYFVRFVEPDPEMTEKKGFLSRLMFWRNNDKTQTGEQYRVQLGSSGETTKVAVLDKAGGAEKTDAANKILALLYDQLK